MNALVRVIVMVSIAITTSAGSASAEPLTKRDTQGPVTVTATIVEPMEIGAPLRLNIALDTHSISVDDVKFEDAVVVRATGGAELRPIAVETKGAGHHRQALLTFPAGGHTSRLDVVVKGVGGVAERVFAWELRSGH